jgi:hypothetical protein
VTHEIGSINRAVADWRPEEIGLTLLEGHELLRDIERRMISDQSILTFFAFATAPIAVSGK